MIFKNELIELTEIFKILIMNPLILFENIYFLNNAN